MPDAPHPSGASGSGLGAVTRKLGPLPVWAWAGVIVIGFLLYRHFRGGGSSAAAPTATGATTDQTYVPPFDAAGASGGGGIGTTGTSPAGISDTAGDVQLTGGGTSTGLSPGTTAGGGQQTVTDTNGVTGTITVSAPSSPPPPISSYQRPVDTGIVPPSTTVSSGIHYFGPGGSGVAYPVVAPPPRRVDVPPVGFHQPVAAPAPTVTQYVPASSTVRPPAGHAVAV